MSEKDKKNINNLTQKDWILISKYIMKSTDTSIQEFKETHIPMWGACETAANKYSELACELNRASEILRKIDVIITDKISQNEDVEI